MMEPIQDDRLVADPHKVIQKLSERNAQLTVENAMQASVIEQLLDEKRALAVELSSAKQSVDTNGEKPEVVRR